MLIIKFYRPVGVYDSIFNKFCALVTGYSQKYCHAEIIYQFSKDEMATLLDSSGTAFLEHRRDSDSTTLAFSVNWGRAVEWRQLHPDAKDAYFRYEPSATDDVHIDLPIARQIKTFQWCLRQIDKPYDTLGALASPVTAMRENCDEYRKYFCSQLAVCCLKQGHFLDSSHVSCVTPNLLYNMLATQTAINATSSMDV